jgi:hypothetical protein
MMSIEQAVVLMDVLLEACNQARAQGLTHIDLHASLRAQNEKAAAEVEEAIQRAATREADGSPADEG